MPSCNTYHLPWVSLTLGMRYFFTAAPAKHSRCSLPWTSGCVLTATVPDLQRRIAPLGPPVPAQPLLLPGFGHGWLLPTATPVLGVGVAPQGHRPWPQAQGGFSRPPLTSDVGCLLPAATGLGRWVAPPGRRPDLGSGVAPPGPSCAVTA